MILLQNEIKILEVIKKLDLEINVSDLAKQTGIDISNISRYWKRLAQKGVIKSRTFQDGKRRVVFLSYKKPVTIKKYSVKNITGPLKLKIEVINNLNQLLAENITNIDEHNLFTPYDEGDVYTRKYISLRDKIDEREPKREEFSSLVNEINFLIDSSNNYSYLVKKRKVEQRVKELKYKLKSLKKLYLEIEELKNILGSKIDFLNKCYREIIENVNKKDFFTKLIYLIQISLSREQYYKDQRKKNQVIEEKLGKIVEESGIVCPKCGGKVFVKNIDPSSFIIISSCYKKNCRKKIVNQVDNILMNKINSVIRS